MRCNPWRTRWVKRDWSLFESVLTGGSSWNSTVPGSRRTAVCSPTASWTMPSGSPRSRSPSSSMAAAARTRVTSWAGCFGSPCLAGSPVTRTSTTPSALLSTPRCEPSSAGRVSIVRQRQAARWGASRPNGSRETPTWRPNGSVGHLDRPRARTQAAPHDHPRHGQFREPDARRAGGLGLERPLRLHLLSPAVRVQPVRRSGVLSLTARQRP